MERENLEKIFDFLHIIENLKSTLRYNFTKSGRKESSAEHSWRLALMLFVLAKELNLDIDIDKSMKLAIVHDLPEAITGDIDAVLIAEGKATKEEKQKKELKVMNKIKKILPEGVGEEIYNLWNEYENCHSKEAKYVKAVDKLETLTQLVDTGYKIYDKPEFIANYADKAIKEFPKLNEVLIIIKRKLKEEFNKGKIPWKEEYDMLD